MLESELGTLDIPHHAALGMHESPALPLPYRHVSCGSLYSACGCGRIKRRQLRLFALSTPPLAFQLFCSPHSPPPPALHHCTHSNSPGSYFNVLSLVPPSTPTSISSSYSTPILSPSLHTDNLPPKISLLTTPSTSMKKTSPDSKSSADRVRSWARTKAHGTSPLSKSSRQTLPLNNPSATPQQTRTSSSLQNDTTNIPPFPSTDVNGLARQSSKPTANNTVDNTTSDIPPPAPPPQVDGEGTVINNDEKPAKKNVAMRFWLTAKSILLSSYINLLLVFVPIGIAAKAAKLSPGIIFGMNAIAIVPLAGLLSHATESVAKRMGDTIGALMNVTFGNAVELIIL